MRYVVLGLLIFAPRTIYQLNKQFQVLLFYQASLGSIRTALQTLVRDGNATVTETIENGRLKKIYSPTERGIATFQEWMHSPISGSNLDTAMLSRLYFLGLIDAPSDRHTILTMMLTRAQKDLTDLESLDRELPTLPHEHRFQRATLDYGIATTAFCVKFLQDLITSEAP